MICDATKTCPGEIASKTKFNCTERATQIDNDKVSLDRFPVIG